MGTESTQASLGSSSIGCLLVGVTAASTHQEEEEEMNCTTCAHCGRGLILNKAGVPKDVLFVCEQGNVVRECTEHRCIFHTKTPKRRDRAIPFEVQMHHGRVKRLLQMRKREGRWGVLEEDNGGGDYRVVRLDDA